MLLRTASIAATMAVALGVTPAQAQQSVTPAARQALECAAYSAIKSDQVEEAEAATGLQFAMTYFLGIAIGRQPELDIVETFDATLINFVAEHIDEIGERCLPQIDEMGDNLSKVGNTLAE